MGWSRGWGFWRKRNHPQIIFDLIRSILLPVPGLDSTKPDQGQGALSKGPQNPRWMGICQSKSKGNLNWPGSREHRNALFHPAKSWNASPGSNQLPYAAEGGTVSWTAVGQTRVREVQLPSLHVYQEERVLILQIWDDVFAASVIPNPL